MNHKLQDAAHGRLTFLIVEDHEVLRKSLGDMIRTHFPGGRILEAEDGQKGVAIAMDSRPDIILMDIRLPLMNGIEATRKIKTDLPQTQVVMLTIYKSHQYQIDAASAGASAYLTKDRMGGELIPVITRLVKGPALRLDEKTPSSAE
jgi:NarL family two-component system response regulator LiaR